MLCEVLIFSLSPTIICDYVVRGLLCKLVLCNALSLTEDLKENVGQGNSEAPAGTILCPKSFRGKTKETRYVSNCVADSCHLHCKSPLTTLWHLVEVRGAMISRVWASVGCVKIGMLAVNVFERSVGCLLWLELTLSQGPWERNRSQVSE